MSVRSGQSITVDFTTRRFDTGAATAADSTPTGTLVVNGTDDAASVTVTSKTGGKYKAAVTLPTLAVGDVVQLRIAATVNSVSDIAVIWQDIKDIVIDSAGLADANTVKLGPSGSGTAQTARDIGTSVLLSSGTGTGQVKLASGYIAPNWGDVGNPTTTVNLSGTTVKTATDVEADTNELQTDLTNGGRLDLIFDAILDDTGTAGVVVTGISAANLAKLEDMLDGTGGQILTLQQLRIAGNDANGAVYITQAGIGDGIHVEGFQRGIHTEGRTGFGISSTVGPALSLSAGASATHGLYVTSAGAQPSVYVTGANNQHCLHLDPSGTGKAIYSDGAMQFDGGISVLTYPAAWDAEIQSECTDAINAYFGTAGDSLTAILNRLPAALISGRMDVTVGAMQSNVMTAAASAADLIAEIQASITGGAYAFNTDANGNVRFVDGTGTGEIDTASGLVRLSSTGVDDIWDEVVQGAYTARQSMRLQNAAAGGKLSGAATTNILIRNLSDTLNAIDATVDSSGNRTAVTLDLSA